MDDRIMTPVKGTESTSSRDDTRGQRTPRAVQAGGRRPSSPRGGGRAWINGREVGGVSRLAYLDRCHD